jgi:hypothetical protein
MALLLNTRRRLHLSRSADADDASAQPQPVTAVVVHPPVTAVVVHPPVTAVVVHPPPFHESPQPRAAAAAHRDDGVAASDPNADAAAANSSPFSLFGVLARWNKEDDGTLRVQEVHEQVGARRCTRIVSFLFGICGNVLPSNA